jgi:hypothetical protein
MRCTTYIQFEAEFTRGINPRVRSITAKRVTKTKPRSPIPGSIVIKVNFEIPESSFVLSAHELDVNVPAENVAAIGWKLEEVAKEFNSSSLVKRTLPGQRKAED